VEIYSGKLVIEVATAVDLAEENIMINNAHEGISSELIKELRLLVGAAGYMVGSVGATLEKVENANQNELNMIKSQIVKSKREVKRVYNKANSVTIKID
jgi:hypothetical protein